MIKYESISSRRKWNSAWTYWKWHCFDAVHAASCPLGWRFSTTPTKPLVACSFCPWYFRNQNFHLSKGTVCLKLGKRLLRCVSVVVPQLKARGSPSGGWEGSSCNCFLGACTYCRSHKCNVIFRSGSLLFSTMVCHVLKIAMWLKLKSKEATIC